MRRRSITEHICAVEQIAIVLPHLLARCAEHAFGYILGQLRLWHEDHDKWEESYEGEEQNDEDEPADDMLEMDGLGAGRSEVVLPFAVTGHPAHDGDGC